MLVGEKEAKKLRKTLEDLYYGNISPWEQRYTKDTEYYKTIHTVSEKEEQLKLLLDEKEQTLLKEMITAQSAINSITAEENFIMGFRLGIRLGIEIMDEGDGCISES